MTDLCTYLYTSCVHTYCMYSRSVCMFMHMYYTVSIIQYIYIRIYVHYIYIYIYLYMRTVQYVCCFFAYIHKQYYIVVSYVRMYVCTYAMLCKFILSVFAPASQGYATYVHMYIHLWRTKSIVSLFLYYVRVTVCKCGTLCLRISLACCTKTCYSSSASAAECGATARLALSMQPHPVHCLMPPHLACCNYPPPKIQTSLLVNVCTVK